MPTDQGITPGTGDAVVSTTDEEADGSGTGDISAGCIRDEMARDSGKLPRTGRTSGGGRTSGIMTSGMDRACN